MIDNFANITGVYLDLICARLLKKEPEKTGDLMERVGILLSRIGLFSREWPLLHEFMENYLIFYYNPQEPVCRQLYLIRKDLEAAGLDRVHLSWIDRLLAGIPRQDLLKTGHESV
jgi:hypothetical protein